MNNYLTIYYTLSVALLIIALYLTRNARIRNIIIIVFSFGFLANISYKSAILILLTSVIIFILGKIINQSRGKKKNVILWLSISYIITVLILFRYLNGFNFKFTDVFGNGIFNGMLLFIPIGISYYSFQLLSYVIEINRGRIQAEKNILIFLEYILYFPKLIAGPIERSYDLVPQLKKGTSISYEDIKYGLILIAFGIFKKFVLAENISNIINPIFEDVNGNSGFSVLISSFLYSFQIYFDFSGYTDIALGTSNLLGIKLKDNFNKPYLSTSISEFWRRWHITLSLWIRDYIFLPVAYFLIRQKFWGMIRINSEKVTYFIATFITMSIFGLWHGFKITFLIWGIYNAILLSFPVLMRKRKKIRKNNQKIIRNRINVFLYVMAGWIIFRANNIEDVIQVYKKIFDIMIISDYFILNRFNILSIIAIMAGISVVMILEILSKEKNSISFILEQRKSVKWVTYFAIMICIAFFGSYGNSSFIYFNF